MALLTNAPLWVWPLLALLLFVGLNALRTRSAPTLLLYALPLLGLLSLRGLLALSPPAAVWLAAALFYLIGAWFGLRFQAPRILQKAARRVQLRGEGLTLVAVLTLFFANFVTGTLRAVAPDMLASTSFQAGFALVLALVSGSFLGRALAVARHPKA